MSLKVFLYSSSSSSSSSSSKSLETIDPRGVTKFNPRGMNGRIHEEDH